MKTAKEDWLVNVNMKFTNRIYYRITLRCIRSELSPDEPGVGCEDGERGILALDVIFHGSEYLLIQRHHVHHHLLLKFDWLKGTVSRDFLLLVFFMNQFPPSP